MNHLHKGFGLTLVVNHACNLRCTYCYTGTKFSAPMPWQIGTAAIQRAFKSLDAEGKLHLGFFGGEPLLESVRVRDWMAFARACATTCGKDVQFNLTTNGTMTGAEAWSIMMAEDLDLAISYDGNPDLHDRHRRDSNGNATAEKVESTLVRLLEAEKPFHVVTVVRPDNLSELPAALLHLYDLGIRQLHLSLDLWTTWSPADAFRLEEFVMRAAQLWRQWLPDFSLNWFDGKIAELARLPMTEQTARCGFGQGEIAVAPSGRLYPCERLVGEDRSDQSLRLAGHALDGEDFLQVPTSPFVQCSPCSQCALAFACDTTCRCSNFIRTGDVNRPDGLLCRFNKVVARATANVLKSVPRFKETMISNHNQEQCYV